MPEERTANARGGREKPEVPPIPLEELEKAETFFEPRETSSSEQEITKIEAEAANADKFAAVAEENIRRLESETAFTPEEMARLEKLARRREENTGTFNRAINAVREKLFGKELAPESAEARELISAVSERLGDYRLNFKEIIQKAKKNGSEIKTIAAHFQTLINKMDDAFASDPRGTIANILETIGDPTPDKTARELWSIGQAGVVMTKFEDILMQASRSNADIGGEKWNSMIDFEPEKKSAPSGVWRRLAEFGIKTSVAPGRVEITKAIYDAMSETEANEHTEPVVQEINAWAPKLSSEPKELTEQVAALKEKWLAIMEIYEKNPTPKEIKAAIRAYLEIVRDAPVSDEEADAIWARGLGGAVLGQAEKRFKTFFGAAEYRLSGIDEKVIQNKLAKARETPTVPPPAKQKNLPQ